MNIPSKATVKKTRFTRSVNFELDDCLDFYKRTQCFVHTDIIDWFKKDLEREAKDFKVSEIIIYEYNDPQGMGIMKCLDVYWNNSAIFGFHIEGLVEISKYKMPWKSNLTYYVRTELKELIMLELDQFELLKFVIHEDNVSVVNWWGNTNLIVITFNNIINIEQLLKLNEIFSTDVFTVPDQPALFISNEVYAFFTTEKLYHNINFQILTTFHGQFLKYLSLEDLLSLELANKNFLTWHDNALNHDIQKHLKDRLPQMYQKRKFEEYYANEFAKSTILSYFMYKYGCRFKTVYIPDQILSKNELALHSVLHGLIIKILEGVVLNLFVVSRKGYPICTIKFIASPFINKVHDQKNFAIRHQELCIDEFDKITSIASSFNFINRSWSYIIKLNISHNINERPAYFDRVLRKLLEIWFSRTIIFKISYNGHHLSNAISRCMSSARVDFATNFDTSITSDSLKFMPSKKYTFEFNQTTFYVQNLVRFMKKLKVNNPNSSVDSNSISLIECRFKISSKIDILLRKREAIPSDLVICLVHFVKMSIDLRVILLILSKTSANIAFDNCHIIPSNNVFNDCNFPETPRSLWFKNMIIGKQMLLKIISTIATGSSIHFSNCTIEWDDQPNSFNSDKRFIVAFGDMDLGLSTLLEFLDIFEHISIRNCQIFSTNPFHTHHNNKSTKCKRIDFINMNIELEIANAILHQLNEFSRPNFIKARVINSNLSRFPSVPVNLEMIYFRYMNYEDHFTSEFLTLLTFLNSGCVTRFKYCRMSNQMCLDIFRSCLRNNIVMTYTNFGQEAKGLNDFVYFDLVLEFYNHNHNLINYEMEMDLEIPKIFPLLGSSYKRFDWQNMKLRSVPINSGITVKLEFLENGMYPIDLFFETNNFTYDSDICEIDYY